MFGKALLALILAFADPAIAFTVAPQRGPLRARWVHTAATTKQQLASTALASAAAAMLLSSGAVSE
jgi:hypothetical protein